MWRAVGRILPGGDGGSVEDDWVVLSFLRFHCGTGGVDGEGEGIAGGGIGAPG